MLKRSLSLILAFVMVFSLVPVQAFAENTTEAEAEQAVLETQAVTEPVSETEPETEAPTEAPAEVSTEASTEELEAMAVPAAGSVMGTVTADRLNLRNEPDISAAVVVQLPVGLRVEILEQQTTNGITWGRIGAMELPNGESISGGWLSMNYVALDAAGQPEGSSNEVTFTFNLPGEVSMTPITVQIGEELVLPECTAENPGFVFSGWDIGRSDVTWLSVDGAFTPTGSREYKPGDRILITADLFDEDTYDYHIGSIWRKVSGEMRIYFHVMDQSIVRVINIGETLAIPDCNIEVPGRIFDYWYLQRADGLVLAADGTFVENYNADHMPFYPGDVIDTSEPLFNFVDYYYYFVGKFSLNESDPYTTLVFDCGVSDMFNGYPCQANTSIVIPDTYLDNPGHEFVGWFLTQNGKWMTETGAFTDDEDVPARCFVPGDEFTVTAEMVELGHLRFHGIWKDAVIIMGADYADRKTVKYGETYELPYLDDLAPDETLFWCIMRSDKTLLAPDGTFQPMEGDGIRKAYEPGQSFVVEADIFDNTKYTYELYSIVHSDGGGSGGDVGGDETVITEEALREVVRQAEENPDFAYDIDLRNDIELSDDLTIPKNFQLYIAPGATLTVPAGKKLLLEGDVYIDGGTLKVAPGAFLSMADNGWSWLGIWSGLLDATGADVSGMDFERVTVQPTNGAEVLGISTTELEAQFNVRSLTEFEEALALAAQYGEADVYIKGALTISEDMEIPENVFINLLSTHIWNEDRYIPSELTFAPGVTVTIHDSLYVNDHGVLTVSEDAHLTIRNHLSINNNGKLLNNGVIEVGNHYFADDVVVMGNGEFKKYKAPGLTEAQLREAVANGEWEILLTDDITLTDDLELPSSSNIYIEEGATITVPAGVKLSLEGVIFINDGTLKIAPGGILETLEDEYYWGYIQLNEAGCLDATGADLSGVIPGTVMLDYSLIDSVIGVDSTKMQVDCKVDNLEQLKFALTLAPQYAFVNIRCWRDFEITENLTIPNRVTLQMAMRWEYNETTGVYDHTPVCVTIAPGVTVTNHGSFFIGEEGSMIISENSTLSTPSTVFIGENGTLVNNGTIYEYVYSIQIEENGIYTGSGKRLPYEEPSVDGEEGFRQALESGYALLEKDITLTDDLTIAENAYVEIQNGATLTIPAGAKLDVKGTLYIGEGTVKVAPGATLSVDASPWPLVCVTAKGLLDATGADVTGVAAGSMNVVQSKKENVKGIPADKQTLVVQAGNESEISKGLALAEEYYAVWGYIQRGITISGELYIPENAQLELYPASSGNKSVATKYTLASGASIYNDGLVLMADDVTLVLKEGSEYYNGMGVIEVTSGATIDNSGYFYSYCTDFHVDDNATLKGDGQYRIAEELTGISTMDEIMAAYEHGSTVLRILESDITVTESIKLPDDLWLEFIGSNLTVAEGVTLSSNTREALTFLMGGKLSLDGSFNGKEIFVENPETDVIPQWKIAAKTKAPVGGWYVEIGAPRVETLTIVEIVDGAAKAPATDIDMKDTATMQLSAVVEPQYASGDVTWATSAANVATVDATGLVTFKKPGTVTITATSTDGTDVSASVRIAVTYLDAAEDLTAEADVPALGLQSGKTAKMLVCGEQELDPVDLIFTTSQADIATVAPDGTITAGSKSGTVTITAAIKGDPLEREVSLKITVIPQQTASFYLVPTAQAPAKVVCLNEGTGEAPKYAVYLDETYKNASFVIKPVAENADGESIVMTDESLDWSTSNSRVATVEAAADGSAIVTVKTDADSTFSICAVTTDYAELDCEVVVYLYNYAPVLDGDTVTLNTYKRVGESLDVEERHDNGIVAVTIHEFSDATKSYLDGESARLEASCEDGRLTIKHKGFIDKNPTIKAQVRFLCENGREYASDVTVKIANKQPSVTIKQTEKFNLFYEDASADFQITAKDDEILYAEIDPDSTSTFFAPFYDEGVMTVEFTSDYINGNTGMDSKVDVLVHLDGYLVPIRKSVSISTTTAAPKLVTDPSSSTVKTDLDDGRTAFFTIYDKATGEELYLNPAVDQVDVDAPFADADVVNGGIELTLTGEKGGSATVWVKCDGWTQSIKVSHKVGVNTKLPAPVLGKSTLKLNRVFTDITDETSVKLNQSDRYIEDIYEFVPANDEAAKIQLTYENGIIKAAIDPDNVPRKGSYKFTYQVKMEGRTELLPKGTITVSVEDKVPSVKLKTGTLKLNRSLGTAASAETAFTMTNGTGYTLVDLVPKNWNNDDIELVFDGDTFAAYLVNEVSGNAKYTVELKPVVYNEDADQTVMLDSVVKLTVQVVDAKLGISTAAKGNLDTMDPDSAITYTVSKLSNIVGEVADVTLADDLGLFDVELDTVGGKPAAVLTRKDGAEVATNATYKLKLVFHVAVETRTGDEVIEVPTEVSVKVRQSALKFVSIPTINMDLDQDDEVTCQVALNTPVTAQMSEIALSSKTTDAFEDALGTGDVTVVMAADGRSAELTFDIENPTALRKGKSYTVYLDVTPVDNATNVNPTQVKLTVKVMK